MRKRVVLVTGASGEMGHGLIEALSRAGDVAVVAFDIHPLDKALQPLCHDFVRGDIRDTGLLGSLFERYAVETVYHLAAVLSTAAERNPERAHRVNVDGTLNLLRLAAARSEWMEQPVRFMFPSSIAVYGLPDLATKREVGAVREDEWGLPTTMYGVNKLYCEHMGRYYARHYGPLDQHPVDFRSIRFPGLISASTLPTGGTSDYGPEMLHAAAQGLPYRCFVREDTRIPFMVMPDAIKALLALAAIPQGRLSRIVYNIGSFSPTAGEIYEVVRRHFPQAEVTFKVDSGRQQIVDSWPEDVDDRVARRDWDWSPDYDQGRAFDEYLIPAIVRRYAE